MIEGQFNTTTERISAMPLSRFVPYDSIQFKNLKEYYIFLRKAELDIVFFVNNIIKPVKMDGNKMHITEYQKESLYAMADAKSTALVCSRQIGKTTTVSWFALWFMFTQNPLKIIVAAPSHKQSSELLTRIKDLITSSPYLNKEDYITIVDKEIRILMSVVLEDGRMVEKIATIESISVGDKADKVRGKTATLLIVDEAGFVTDSVMSRVVAPMAASVGCRRVYISTPNGKNHFYSTFTDPDNGFVKLSYDYTYGVKEGVLSEEYVEQQRRTDPASFDQEYCCKFLSENVSFLHEGLFLHTTERYEAGDIKNIIGDVKASFFIGLDWATSGSDETVATVVALYQENNDLHYAIVDWIAMKTGTFDEKMFEIKKLYRKYHVSHMAIDASIGSDLESTIRNSYGMNNVMVRFTQQKKYEMYQFLKIILENKKIKIPKDNILLGPKYVSQSISLEKIISIRNPIPMLQPPASHMHDDYPDSLVLALDIARSKVGLVGLTSSSSISRQSMEDNFYDGYSLHDGQMYYQPNYFLDDDTLHRNKIRRRSSNTNGLIFSSRGGIDQNGE